MTRILHPMVRAALAAFTAIAMLVAATLTAGEPQFGIRVVAGLGWGTSAVLRILAARKGKEPPEPHGAILEILSLLAFFASFAV